MGVCDLIPGISGGTIAFITGIYERLINAIKGFSPRIFNRSLKENLRILDIRFLIVLASGIIFSILIGAGIIENLLEHHYVKTISFFIGMILASSVIIFEHIKEHNTKNHLYFGLGMLFGIGIIFLNPSESFSITRGYLFLGGFLAISAMFLPGISGSFILLIMGLYEYIIGILHNPLKNISEIIIFMLGAILGATIISRVISYLFAKDKNKTLYFLLGLVLGSLGVPIIKIYQIGIVEISSIYLGLLGVFVVLFVRRYARN